MKGFRLRSMACCNKGFIIISLVLLFLSQTANAQRLPKWELGLALGYVSFPYYRGAEASRNILLPLPLAIVRDEKRRKNRRLLFVSKRINLGLSLAATLPVPKNGKVLVRAEMPGLDTTLELGPQLEVSLWRHGRHRLSGVLPLRAVSALSFKRISLQGWKFSPYFLYRYVGKRAWKFDALAGPIYGSSAYHNYYYGVSRADVTAERGYFDAKQGYSGSRASAYLQKSIGRLWLSAFARYDILSGAAFEDSALVEKETSLFGGFVVGWVFKKSPELVYVRQN